MDLLAILILILCAICFVAFVGAASKKIPPDAPTERVPEQLVPIVKGYNAGLEMDRQNKLGWGCAIPWLVLILIIAVIVGSSLFG